MNPSRYHRQTLLPQIGAAGQQCLAASRVLLIGCGALGTTLAEQLVRAGVGWLKIVDRDLVEWTNLQRQSLFDEKQARDAAPKAIAAADRLRAINSDVEIVPEVADVDSRNVERLIKSDTGGRVELVLDGTDNALTRYLVNDVCIKHAIPWVYGGCVGTEGRMLAVRPPETACLRCLFPEPPSAGETRTCDTVGVLGPSATIVASLQAIAALKILTGNTAAVAQQLVAFDCWSEKWRHISTTDAKRADCPACGLRRFDFLDSAGGGPQILCGRNAVQFRAADQPCIDLALLAEKLEGSGTVRQSRHLLRYCPDARADAPAPAELVVFADGRVIIHGTADISRAKSLYSRYLGG